MYLRYNESELCLYVDLTWLYDYRSGPINDERGVASGLEC